MTINEITYLLFYSYGMVWWRDVIGKGHHQITRLSAMSKDNGNTYWTMT